MSFFDKILNVLTGSEGAPHELGRGQISLLKQALDPLDKAASGLAARTFEFVLKGTQENVLLELPAMGSSQKELGVLLGRPGRLRWAYRIHNQDEVERLGNASLAARARFYASIPADSPPLDVLVRLGKALAAADAGVSLEHPGAPVPDWLQYLVNDAVFASFNERAQKTLDKTRPAWTIELISRLLARDGLDETLALQLVFERKGLDSYYHDHLLGLVDTPFVTAYMHAHPQAVEALTTQLSATGRIVFARRLGSDRPLLGEFAHLLVRLAVDSSKGVRTEASQHIESIETARRLELLEGLLRSGDSTQRTQAAELIARLPADAARVRLEAALDDESSKAVQQAIRAALSRLDAADDAGGLELPEPPPWQPFEDAELGEEALQLFVANHRELLDKARQAAEAEIQENRTGQHTYKWRQKNYADMQKVGEADLRSALMVLNGKGKKQDNDRTRNNNVQQCVMLGARLQALPAFRITHMMRWLTIARHWGSFWMDNNFQKWLARQVPGSVDLRALAELFQSSGISLDEVASCALRTFWNTATAAELLPPERVWPFFAEHPEYIDEGLGLVAPPKRKDDRIRLELGPTLRTLATFPTIQARWLPRVMELALGEGKTYRSAAQAALSSLPDIGRRVIEALGSTKSEVRIEAANWLADLKHGEAISVLTGAIEKESRETVRAVYLTAIEALGADISPWLAPERLLAEAKKGLKAKPPAGLAWFSMDALPACCWADGKAIEPEIIKWWVVLACKLKEPGGNALLTRYLGLLDAPSRQALGRLVLRQFIAQDTRHPSLEEGIAYAQANAPQRYQRYQKYYLDAKPEHKQWYETDYNKTQEQVFEECKREKMSEYLGSAIGEKGILALIAFAPAHETVTQLQQYMRDHYQRRAQIEAMIEAAAAGNDPVLIQFLLGIARRYRTTSVQEKARLLVQQIADRNDWSQEQLADRTAPTAGLDDTGKLELQYGQRIFTLTLDAAMKPELRNPDGKVVKTLPDARQNDDPALIKEAKSQLSNSKKELKQIIELQTARLFEAMCAGRQWPQNEWWEYLHRHPIVGRLIQQLVWLETAPDGTILRSFRPTEDGSLIDAQDDEIEQQADSLIRLGHASLVGETASDWVTHFKDYKVVPLFPQMTRNTPIVAFKDDKGCDVKEIADRRGWISDTFTLRGAFTKLGYQRSQAEDGGFFSHYFKEFPSVGVRVAIEFSGNCLPEENLPAALKALVFEDMGIRTWGDRTIPLAKVPPVLLAEAYADYLAVAQACSGFDANWEKKMPW